jgi:hypothetical protein
MKRTSLGLTRGTSLNFTGGMDRAIVLHNYRKGVSIEIRIEPADIPRLHEWLGEVLAAAPRKEDSL